jgi:hypothetical protein
MKRADKIKKQLFRSLDFFLHFIPGDLGEFGVGVAAFVIGSCGPILTGFTGFQN